MARGNQGINDQLFRTRGRNAVENRETQEEIRRRQIRSWIILVLIVAVAALGFTLLRGAGKTTEITANILPCYPDQDVTVFGNNVLYYDAPAPTGKLQRIAPPDVRQ